MAAARAAARRSSLSALHRAPLAVETRDDEARWRRVKNGKSCFLHGGNIDTHRRMIHHMTLAA